jgi:predicted secreted protein
VVVYLLIWWTALFCVLPLGTRPVEDADPDAGGCVGRRPRPLLLRKVVGTTVLASILWVGAYALITSEWISFREGWWAYQGPGISSPMPGRAQN